MILRQLFSFIAPLGFLRLYFGGGGGSSSADNTTENTDNRITQQSGTAVSGSDNTITVLDGGAIENAFKFAQASQASSVSALTTTAQLVSDAYAESKGRGKMTDYVLIGALAVAGLVAVTALRK
jgi:hypothetical protein